jgi:hypothetical protein
LGLAAEVHCPGQPDRTGADVTSLIDLKLQNDRVENAIDRMTDILLLIRTERPLRDSLRSQPDRNDLLWQIYGRARLHMNTESARLHLMIEQLQVEHKERNEMRIRMMSIVGILLVALLLVGGMAVAQDTPTADVVTLEATAVETISSTAVTSPEPTLDVTATASAEPTPTETPVPPPPDDETPTVSIWVLIAPYLSVIGIAILGVIAYLGRAWLVPAGARVPGVIFEPVVAGLNKGLETYGEFVKITPEKTDDVQYEEFAKTFRELIEEMRQARNELNSAAAQLVSTSQSVAQRPVDPSQF